MAVGSITYTDVTCPSCGAVIKVGTQAVSPAYTYTAWCPYCGTYIMSGVVSAEIVSGPTVPAYYPVQEGFDMSTMMNMIMFMIMMGMMIGLVVPIMKPLY